MFLDTKKLYLEYLRYVIDNNKINPANNQRHLALELAERIDQLHYVVVRVQELEELISNLSSLREAKNPSAESECEQRARTELKVLTESFYYCAARARSVARNKEFPLPGLKSFECSGVRNVRNKLLEHPEGSDSEVFMVSFGYGGCDGPVIKPLRAVGQENTFPDTGLFQNAKEFKDNLELLLKRELVRVGRNN